jgi:L-aminopeptidase/D-esterase-like protein
MMGRPRLLLSLVRTIFKLRLVFCAICLLNSSIAHAGDRARDLGIEFSGIPGPLNAITDVSGVEVGQFTKIDPEGAGGARTGITGVFPLGSGARAGVRAGRFSFNGAGELTGTHIIDEFGVIFGPVVLTGTSSLGAVHSWLVEWARQRFPKDNQVLYTRLIPVVGETYDGNLNDISRQQMKQQEVFSALDQARSGKVEEGNVGGGTAAICFGFKCGIGTSSRLVEIDGKGQYTVGVLVQANHGRKEALRISGVRVGENISGEGFSLVDESLENRRNGSIIVVVGTDAPLDGNQLEALARRATLGLALTGGMGEMGSGDIFVAFSTRNVIGLEQPSSVSVEFLTEISPLYEAVAHATEEAIINALIAGRELSSTTGATAYRIPLEELGDLLDLSK